MYSACITDIWGFFFYTYGANDCIFIFKIGRFINYDNNINTLDVISKYANV